VKRLTPALLTMIMFGVVGLLIVAYVAKNLLAVEETAPESTEELIPMAIADVAPGTRLTEAHLGRGPYPKNRLEPDMLRTTRVIENRYARVAIKAGQPIRANDLLPPGELPSLRVAEGMRALAVEVSDTAAMVDGMIKPGDYVDVLFTYQGANDDTYQGGLTMRLFEGVRILVVNRGASSSRVDRGGNHVTLELTEQQANVLTLARDRGDVTLTYNPSGRGTGGLALSSSERVTLYEILGLKPAEPAEPIVTEIYRGTARSANRFNEKGRLIDGAVENERPRQELSPAPPARPADGKPADQPTSPTAVRRLLETK
jgi:pilus assembly protein CpaB